jgi:hypothetical protein
VLPFPSRFPDPLTPDPALAAHLSAAITHVLGASPLRASIGFAAIDDTATPRVYNYAGVGDTDTHYSASLLKVAAMYAAFQLRSSTTQFAAMTAIPVFAAFFTDLAAAFDPVIAAAVPALASDPEILAKPAAVQADVARTKYGAVLAATPVPMVGASVVFTSTFAGQLKRAIVDSSNGDAASVIKALGYRFLNGALEEGGFFDATTQDGVWLAGTFDGTWPRARIPSVNDGPVAQAMTCLDMARMYTLMDSRQLVDGASSDEMLDLLKRAQSGPDPSFLTRTSVLQGATVSYRVTHTKIGLGPLKASNGGFSVASEGTFVTHTSTGKRFLVVFQNNRNLTTSLKALSRIIDKAIRLHLVLP